MTATDRTGATAMPALGPVVAVLAVKMLGAAKTRLAAPPSRDGADHVGAGASVAERLEGRRAELVLAMLADTVESAREAGLHRVIVVSPDSAVLAVAVESGAEPVAEPADLATLNRALAHGAAYARRTGHTGRMVFLQADLPAAQPYSLREIVTAGASYRAALLADRSGSGTALLMPPLALATPPLFGAQSARAHREAGATELDPARLRWPDVRTDVDTLDDLAAAVDLGVRRHTAELLGIAAPSSAPRPTRGQRTDGHTTGGTDES